MLALFHSNVHTRRGEIKVIFHAEIIHKAGHAMYLHGLVSQLTYTAPKPKRSQLVGIQ